MESGKDGCDSRNIREAIKFLSDFNPNLLSEVEIEMCLMHAAFILDSRNAFNDNYNVSNKNLYIDHVLLVKEADLSAWCQKLYDLSFWHYYNRVIVNIVFNWLRDSFSSFERIVP
jgi:hypothetical protein